MSKLLTVEQWGAFRWRVYNVFKSTILPIVLGMILLKLQETGNFDGVMSGSFWIGMLYAVVVALIGSALAGLDKVTRMKQDS